MTNQIWRVGDVEITKLVEAEFTFPSENTGKIIPDADPTCVLRAAEISEGPVFRTFALPRGRRDYADRLQEQRIDGRDVARIVQRAITLAGLDGDFAAHSLQAAS